LGALGFQSSGQQFEQVPISVPGVFNPGFSWVDFDQDGDFDLHQGGRDQAGNGALTLLIHTNLSLEPAFSIPIDYSMTTAWADYDGDGDLDFAPGGYSQLITGQRLYQLHRNEDGSFVGNAPEIDSGGSSFWADMDRDGDLDLVFAGISSEALPSSSSWRIFLNRRGKPWALADEFSINGLMQDIAARAAVPIPSRNARDPIVADWNGDGWPDLVHIYRDFADQWILHAYLNGPGLSFTTIEIPFGSTDTPYFSAWGDYDNDGDLDLAFNGERGTTRVFNFVRNDGNALSSFLVEEIAGLALAWADFDNDGLLDVTITDDYWDGSNSFVRRYRNLGASSEPFFAPEPLPMPGAGVSGISATDFDNDGDQDLLISGLTNGVPSTRLFRNLLNSSNPPPTTPTDLGAVVTTNGAIHLSWSPATDANQAGGLSYNVWIHRADSAHFLLSPGADTNTGRLFIQQHGNAGVITNFVLTNLLAGNYRWSVQAVDNSFASSPFAAASEFVVSPGLPRIEEFSVSDIRFQHATLAAEVIGNGSDTAAWFEYGTDTNFTLRTEPVSIGQSHLGAWITNEVTDLLTAQTYFVRAAASNDLGFVYSEASSFFITNQLPNITVTPVRITAFPGQVSPPVIVSPSDIETSLENLNLDIEIITDPRYTSNTNILSLDDVQSEISGTNLILRFFSPPDEYGFVQLRFTVTDEHGGTRFRNVDYNVNVFNRFGNIGSIADETAPVDVDSDGLIDLLDNRQWLRNTDGTNFSFKGSVIANFNAYSRLATDDIDNDGTVDLAFFTRVSNAAQTKIFTNSPTLAPLPHAYRSLTQDLSPDFFSGVLSYMDFDLDGDADLFASGVTNLPSIQGYERVVWRNEGDKVFTPLYEVFPRLHNSALAWTDYNQDGAPDLFLLGITNRLLNTPYTELLLNDGFGNFESSGLDFPAYSNGIPLWGDFDSDGRPDLLIAGVEGNPRGTNTVTLFQNMPDGRFVERVRFQALPIQECFVADFNNDGALDLLYQGSEVFSFYPVTKIYLNRGDWTFADASPMVSFSASTSLPPPYAFADFNRDGILDLLANSVMFSGSASSTNEPPTAPENLVVHLLGETSLLLAWDPATDSTETNGLTYNVRVGTRPGGTEIMSPLSRPDGRRLVARPGNAFHSLKRMLRNLAPGTYYWSVQAVDNSLEGGPFAPEQTFTIAAPVFP
jgi:hypothetical protein